MVLKRREFESLGVASDDAIRAKSFVGSCKRFSDRYVVTSQDVPTERFSSPRGYEHSVTYLVEKTKIKSPPFFRDDEEFDFNVKSEINFFGGYKIPLVMKCKIFDNPKIETLGQTCKQKQLLFEGLHGGKFEVGMGEKIKGEFEIFYYVPGSKVMT